MQVNLIACRLQDPSDVKAIFHHLIDSLMFVLLVVRNNFIPIKINTRRLAKR